MKYTHCFFSLLLLSSSLYSMDMKFQELFCDTDSESEESEECEGGYVKPDIIDLVKMDTDDAQEQKIINKALKTLLASTDEVIIVDMEEDEKTALHFAARNNNVKQCKLLLNYLNPHVTDKFQQTPLHVAAGSGSPRTAEHLLATTNASLMALDAIGNTPLHCAAVEGKDDIIELLFDYAQSEGITVFEYVNIANYFGLTPLHYAVLNGKHTTTEILLQHGASPYAQTGRLNAFDLAQSKQCNTILALLNLHNEIK